MKQSALNKIALACLPLLLVSAAQAADPAPAPAPAKITMICNFPAAKVAQIVKPGIKGVSNGVLRIDATQMTFKICDGCTWETSGGKWKVDAKQYRLTTPGGIATTINRTDGTAVFSLTTREDENYKAAHVESRGKCVNVKQ